MPPVDNPQHTATPPRALGTPAAVLALALGSVAMGVASRGTAWDLATFAWLNAGGPAWAPWASALSVLDLGAAMLVVAGAFGLRRPQVLAALLLTVVLHLIYTRLGGTSAANEIALGNQDLSMRTEQQASALQEASSAMHSLGEGLQHSATNAEQAYKLATDASKVASDGGAVVHQVVDTMKGIHEASKRIVDIIATIDGIAFQTNILALNAAVEAARAGEQGRGFAVVASEVRVLAQRSAAAAREIKGLITVTADRAEAGSALVDQAGMRMHGIEAAIGRVTALMNELAQTSSSQSQEVLAVDQSVSRIDESTQQNAALVEQSAAATERLRQQAESLVQGVSVFKLEPSFQPA